MRTTPWMEEVEPRREQRSRSGESIHLPHGLRPHTLPTMLSDVVKTERDSRRVCAKKREIPICKNLGLAWRR
jgi:hypothetical protein